MFKKTLKTYIVDFNGVVNHKNVKQFFKDMEYVKKRKNIKQIIVRLSCPGGSPSLSEEVMSYLKIYNKDIEIIMYVEEIAASGGYYIASSIHKIYSNKNAIIGSIGVIMQKFEVSKLADKIGIQEDNISVGEYKQPLSLFKPSSDEDKEYIKKHLMNPTYELFIDTISINRNIDKDIIKKEYADGKVFIANDVIGSLIDHITTFSELIQDIDTKNIIYVDTKKKTFKERLGLSFIINIPELNSNTIKFI